MARDDQAHRRAFRLHVQHMIESGQSPSFAFLTDGQGKWHDWTNQLGRKGVYSDRGEKGGWIDTPVDAGHTRSSAAGEHLYAIECSNQNRRDGATLERAGHILEKAVVLIEGLPINRAIAHDWEQKGVFRKGTVEAAPAVVGWSKERGIVTSRAGPAKETSAALARAQKLKAVFNKVASPQKDQGRARC